MEIKLHNGETVRCSAVKYMVRETPGEEVDRVTKQIKSATGRTYAESLRLALNDKDLLRRYAADGCDCDTASSTGTIRQTESAGAEVHRRTQKLMRAFPGLSYAEALSQTLAADPALKAKFAAVANASGLGEDN